MLEHPHMNACVYVQANGTASVSLTASDRRPGRVGMKLPHRLACFRLGAGNGFCSSLQDDEHGQIPERHQCSTIYS